MHNKQLIRLLGTLQSKEVDLFVKHFKANYPKQKIAIQVLEYLQKHHPHYSDSKYLELDTAYKKMFGAPPENKTDRKKLLNSLSDLKITLKDFLISQQVLAKEDLADLIWIEILKERKLDGFFFRNASKKIAALQNKKEAVFPDFLLIAKLHYHTFFHASYSKLKREDIHLEQFNQYLDYFYIALKLKINTEIKNRNNILKTEDNSEMLIDLESKLKQENFKEKITFQIYTLLLQFVSSPNQKQQDYNRLKALFLEKYSKLLVEDQISIITYLINYNSNQIKMSKLGALQEAFSLYNFGLEEQILTSNGYITPTTFSNITNVASRLKEFEWARNFIVTYSQQLPKEVAEDNKNIALAIIAFEEDKFDEVLNLLSNIDFSDIHLKLRARALILRSYYEMEDMTKVMESYRTAFQKFVRSNRGIQGNNELAALNFILCMKYLIERKLKKEEISAKLEDMTMVFHKTWLLEKLKDYKKTTP